MILSHKFEYGYNEEGGRKWASKESLQRESIQDNQIKTILNDIPKNYIQCNVNKAHDNK